MIAEKIINDKCGFEPWKEPEWKELLVGNWALLMKSMVLAGRIEIEIVGSKDHPVFDARSACLTPALYRKLMSQAIIQVAKRRSQRRCRECSLFFTVWPGDVPSHYCEACRSRHPEKKGVEKWMIKN